MSVGNEYQQVYVHVIKLFDAPDSKRSDDRRGSRHWYYSVLHMVRVALPTHTGWLTFSAHVLFSLIVLAC